MDLEPPSPNAPVIAAPIPALTDEVLRRLHRPIVLVGMMGVGKSSLGRKLAHALGWGFVDADEEIELAAQQTIPEIFAHHGEAYFRDGERRVIARLLGENPETIANTHPYRVIATGGGAFCNPQTRDLILSAGLAVWLDAELDTLVDRTSRKDNRPLLKNGNPREILGRLRSERAPLYALAPIHVSSDSGPHTRTLTTMLTGIIGWLDAQEAASRTDTP